MHKKYTFILLGIISQFVFSQETYRITYEKFNLQRKVVDSNPIQVLANTKETIIGTENSFKANRKLPNEITYYNATEKDFLYSIIQLDSLKTLKTVDSTSLARYSFKYLNETKKILGIKAKKAQLSINSNTIDLWYADNLGIKAAPNSVGINLGLILEYTRNNNYTIKASKIERIKENPSNLYSDEITLPTIDQLTYKDLVWKNKFTTIPILKNQTIKFSNNLEHNDSIYLFAKGTIVVRKINFPYIKQGSQIFLDVKERSNGDAYDRTGSVFIIPMRKTKSIIDGVTNRVSALPIYENGNGKQYQGMVNTDEYEPPVELMRFFTPFGIHQFNHNQIKDKTWHEAVDYRQDISEYRDLMSDQEVWIGYFIGNYDEGGHMVNSNITIHDSDQQLIKNNKSLSLFNTTNIMEMIGQEYPTLFNQENGLFVEFELKEDWKNAKLRYTTTGHGGWANGDEFLPKNNSIFLDNKIIFNLAPWRQDCGSYRLYNPVSGNFDNGLSSSDYSRSNWCPGTITNPYYIDLGNLKAGKHSIQVKIPQGEPEGGSFSYWLVSGVLLGE